ncbi:MAG: DNA gyrase C-terminal beta-propeller domain-containing protein, partial [Candidatus Woesearchaeota archaeon]
AAGTKEEDAISQLFITNTHSYILIFTNQGKIHWLKVYKIPEASRQALGKAIVNFVELKDGEIINAIISIKEFNDKEYLTFCTERGIIKKTNLAEYSRPRQGGIIAINLDAGDRLVKVMLTNGMKNIIIATSNGRAVKFDERDVSVVGRNARGVRGIKVEKDDKVIGMVEAEDTKSLLTITENGFGKRTMISEYRLIRRGGSGVTNIVCSPRNGKVVGIKTVVDSDEIIIISKKGIIIRTKAEYIKCIGRNTQGVRLMKLSQDDKVVGIEKIVNGERNSSEINTNYSRS